MALNNSGPISLGGATAGESINLELGNAATAVASIDSAPFRTLANVPSGAITLSNFYGKSSNSYWAIIGQYSTFFNGFAASVNGILCLGGSSNSAQYNSRDIYFFNSDGTLAKSTATEPGISALSYVESSVNNNSTSAPIFYIITDAALRDGYGFAPFNHTTNTNYFTGNLWKRPRTGGEIKSSDNALKGIFADASNNIYVVQKTAQLNIGKDQIQQAAYSSYTSSGTLRYSFSTTGNNAAPAQFRGGNYAALRSDGTIVVVGCTNSSTMGLYTINTSTGVADANYTLYSIGDCNSGDGGVVIDSSNNVYVIRNAVSLPPVVFKLNSSYSPVAAKAYGNPSGSYLAGFRSNGTMYNDIIYLLSTNNAATNSVFVIVVNSTTLAPIFSLQCAFTGITGAIAGDFWSQGQSAIRVTSVGIYTRINFFVGATNYTCVLKLPLDGNISGAKTLTLSGGAGTCTVTFTYSTSVWSASDFAFSTSSTPSMGGFVSRTGGEFTGQAPANTVAPSSALSNF